MIPVKPRVIIPPFQMSPLSMAGLLMCLSEHCLGDWLSNALTTQHFLALVQSLSVFVNLLTSYFLSSANVDIFSRKWLEPRGSLYLV